MRTLIWFYLGDHHVNPTLLNPSFYFINGATCMGAWVCGLFFLRFWRKSQDRLFLIFAASFWLLAVERLLFLVLRDIHVEDHAAIYSLRLLAFLMILIGIWDKNRARNATPIYGS
ncbi:MAG: DUF5985 family protein [Bdellovibrionota bacterium]